MIIEINRLKDINETGVYKIINIVNNKFYIGSTSESFIKRICGLILDIHLAKFMRTNSQHISYCLKIK